MLKYIKKLLGLSQPQIPASLTVNVGAIKANALRGRVGLAVMDDTVTGDMKAKGTPKVKMTMRVIRQDGRPDEFHEVEATATRQ